MCLVLFKFHLPMKTSWRVDKLEEQNLGWFEKAKLKMGIFCFFFGYSRKLKVEIVFIWIRIPSEY